MVQLAKAAAMCIVLTDDNMQPKSDDAKWCYRVKQHTDTQTDQITTYTLHMYRKKSELRRIGFRCDMKVA